MGPDELHPCLLKSCSDSLSYPVWLIFKKSLDTGQLPLMWKRSLVVPIYKKGSCYAPLNYRPVSLTCVLVKCMEHILVDFIFSYVNNNNLLDVNQYSFRSGKSTEDQLLFTYNDITKWVDHGHNADLILFDFSKAFDVVVHDFLVQKLLKLGIRGKILDWI